SKSSTTRIVRGPLAAVVINGPSLRGSGASVAKKPRLGNKSLPFSVRPLCSLCLCGLGESTTEAQRTQRLHREELGCSLLLSNKHRNSAAAFRVGKVEVRLRLESNLLHQLDDPLAIGEEDLVLCLYNLLPALLKNDEDDVDDP